MELGLNSSELDELNKSSNSLNLDACTKKLAINFLVDYKQKSRFIVGHIFILNQFIFIKEFSEKLPLFVNCAILAASKSQVLTTLKGETIRGVGISITQLIRGVNNNSSKYIKIICKKHHFIP